MQSFIKSVKCIYIYLCNLNYLTSGDVALSTLDLGYSAMSRNFFETSHAKGPQDAAGGLVKNQIDLAVHRGNSIQSAHDLYTYAQAHLTSVKSGTTKQRIFRYLDKVSRPPSLSFKPVKENRFVKILLYTFLYI